MTTISENRLFDITGENSDVKYFDEKIKEKLGRSRFAKAEATPFLGNKDYATATVKISIITSKSV